MQHRAEHGERQEKEKWQEFGRKVWKWLRHGLMNEILGVPLEPVAPCGWHDLLERCERADATLTMINSQTGRDQWVIDLWDRARHAGGVENPSRPLTPPTGRDKPAMLAEVADLLIWVQMQRAREAGNRENQAPAQPIEGAVGLSEISDPIRLTIAEAAKYLRVSDRTVREWRTNGKLAVAKDENGLLLFSKSTLDILRASRH
jgi:excisionase family DNA binding protein